MFKFKRSKIIMRSTHIENKTIFQANIYISPPSIKYISELRECTSSLSHNNRREFFYANGIDYDNMIKYYDYIENLENTIQRDYSKNIIESILHTIVFHINIFIIVVKAIYECVNMNSRRTL